MFRVILLTNARYHYFSIQPICIHPFGYLRAENMINDRASLESGESLISEGSSETSINSTICRMRSKKYHLLLLAHNFLHHIENLREVIANGGSGSWYTITPCQPRLWNEISSADSCMTPGDGIVPVTWARE
jgi:hypothetical protein